MNKGRSTYPVQFNTDSNTINNLMQSYLNAENFKIYEKKGEQYFRAGDQMMGYRGLKYSINGQTLTIEAWLDGALGNFPLEQNSMNIMAMNYRNSLNNLFQEISKLNGGNMNNNQMRFDPNTGQPINQNINNNGMKFDPQTGQPIQNNNQQVNQNNNINQFAQTFQNENEKKQEKMCEIGFWISILGLLCSFTGVAMGLLVYIMDFYFASQGLKTRKKGKAIATIVISILSIFIFIVYLISA